LERTGRIVTAAALLMSVVFVAFATSEVSFIKLFGIGLALAVLMDAFVIRGLLVPAFMRLAGEANWWAPPFLRRVHDRVGIREDGYEVVGLTKPLDVMAQLTTLDPDVVVLDKVMPERDGLDVAEDIREVRPEQPIVIFSSLFDRRLSQETRRLGYVYCEKAG